MDDLDDAQPSKTLYGPRVAKRRVSELPGLCKGTVCDGEISEGGLSALKRWLAGHPDAAVLYPAKTVAERLLRGTVRGAMNLTVASLR